MKVINRNKEYKISEISTLNLIQSSAVHPAARRLYIWRLIQGGKLNAVDVSSGVSDVPVDERRPVWAVRGADLARYLTTIRGEIVKLVDDD